MLVCSSNTVSSAYRQMIYIIGYVFIILVYRQIVVNCRTGEADKSMSFWLLLFWFFSDCANFLGAILSNQLITLVVIIIGIPIARQLVGS